LPSILKGNSALEIGEDDVEELGKKRKTRLDRLHILSSINIKNNPN